MDPIGMATGKRQVNDEFAALKADADREQQLEAIVAQARKLRPRRRVQATPKMASLPGPGLMPPMAKQPTASPTLPSPMVPPIPPSPMGAASPVKQPMVSPAMPAAPPVDPFPQPQALPVTTPVRAPTHTPAVPGAVTPPMPTIAPSQPKLPRAAPTSPMPGESSTGSLPRTGDLFTANEATGTLEPTTKLPAGGEVSGPSLGSPGGVNPYPNSPSAKMFYDLAGSLGGDAGRNFVNGLPRWAQQYGLPIGGGLAGLLGMYLLSRFMGGRQQKMAETARVLETMHGKEAWNSVPGESLPDDTKVSTTSMTNTSC